MPYILMAAMLCALFWVQACTNEEKENQERLKELAEWISIRTELNPLLKEAGHKNVPIEDDFRVPVFPRLSTHDRAQYAAYLVHEKNKPCSSISYFFANIGEFTLHCNQIKYKYLIEKKGIDWYVTAD